MEKELKGYVIEIMVITIFLIITVPICAKASNDYTTKKESLLNAFNATIDVNNKNDMKELSIYSNADKQIEVKLGLKMTKYYDEYSVIIDNRKYNLKDLDYKEDEENIYYILGTYEIDEVKKIDFKLIPNNQSYFKENIIYSFYTEGTLENGRL